MVVGIRKGGSFELKIYKDLRKDYNNVRRTIGSGSSDEVADIILKIADKDYSIECKHIKQVKWYMLNKFWRKLRYSIGNHNLIPIIVFRQNREPIMVMCIMKCNNKNVRGITSYNIWKQTLD